MAALFSDSTENRRCPVAALTVYDRQNRRRNIMEQLLLKNFENDSLAPAMSDDIGTAVACAFGNYKMSLHSGSDKFAVYPAFARHTKGLLHVKTAYTDNLERHFDRHFPLLEGKASE